MHIGIDLRPLLTPHRTGVGEYTFELLNAIFTIDKNNDYYLFYNSYSDVSKYVPKWSQNNIHYVNTHWPNKIMNAAITAFKHPKLDKIVIENLDYWFSPNLGFTTLSKKTKHLLTIHDLSFEFFPEFYTTKQRLWHKLIHAKKQCKEAHHIITPSENTKRDIVTYYKIDPSKITVIYPGQSSVFSLQSSLNQDQRLKTKDYMTSKYTLPKNFLLFLGTIEPRKNIETLITAFEQAYPLLPRASGISPWLRPTQYSLVIAGAPGWKNKSIFERIKKSPLHEKIHYIGFVDPTDKPTLYSTAELFICPSLYEGFGFPVLEAMAAGTPVITSNRSSLPEVTGSATYLINPHRPEEIAEGIHRLLTIPTLQERAIKNGLEQAKKFSWEQAAKMWLKILSLLD